jgi:hypothetical protein
MTDINGYNRKTTDTIISNDLSSSIQLGSDEIDLIAGTVLINGAPIGGGGGVDNPMTSILDCASNNIINMGTFNTNMNSFVIATEGALSTQQGDIGTLQTKTQLLTSNATISTFSESLRVREFLTVAKAQPTLDPGNCGALFILDGGLGSFSIFKANGSNIDKLFEIGTVAKIDMYTTLDMNNKAINNVTTINGLTPANGVYAGTSDSIVVNASNSPASLVPVTGVGFLTVPANTFTIGASYHLVASGFMPSEQKGDFATIELTSTNGVTVSLGSITVELDASADTAWECEGDFTCRSIGVNGVFIASFELTFNKDLDKNFRGSRKISSAIIDTTVQQSLDIVGTLTGTSSFQTRLLTLTRVF